jgi:ATP-dependent helicase/nuclease subunit B
MSSGRFERIGQCPLKFFFRNGLEIELPEEIRLDATQWLDPLATGSLLHQVFEEFIRGLIREQQLPRFPQHLQRLTSVLETRIQMYRELYPPLNEHVYETQQDDLKRVARTFLVEEDRYCSESHSRPAYLEASLGMVSEGEGTEIDTDEPIGIRLPNQRTVRVRGRIDRIDEVGQGAVRSLVIWDYKTGSSYKYQPADPFRQGRIVQPALYLVMVGHRLREATRDALRVAKFGFFFPGRRERGRRIEWTPDQLADGGRVLATLVEIIRKGAFLATTEADDCRYCDYSAICGDVETLAAASRAKLEKTSNEVLEPYRELRGDGET